MAFLPTEREGGKVLKDEGYVFEKRVFMEESNRKWDEGYKNLKMSKGEMF